VRVRARHEPLETLARMWIARAKCVPDPFYGPTSKYSGPAPASLEAAAISGLRADGRAEVKGGSNWL
jgi:hypothetical protein